MRIHELAKKLGVKSADIISELKKMGIVGKTASSSIDEKSIALLKKNLGGTTVANAKKKTAKAKTPAKPSTVVKKIAESETTAQKAVKPQKVEPEKKDVIRKQEEDRKKAEEEEKRKKAEEEARLRQEEEEKKKEEETLRKAENEKKRKEDKELQKLIEEEDRAKREEEKRKIVIDEAITVKELAGKINLPVTEIIKRLFVKGVAVTVNQVLGVELASDMAKEIGFTIKVGASESKVEDVAPKADLSHLPVRPPIVTVMGHVDHGKTTLLDAIRKTKVAESEAGGITQHIGAHTVKTGNGRVTFLDTPGHEAFTAIRARGARVTDLVVLVVAADDGIMPQTEEAINHAKAAGVPIIVAVNKIDVPDANPDRIKQELGKFGLLPEDWGGQTIICNVSAKTGDGVDNLLEMIQLQSELLELHADPKKQAEATVIESRLDRARGPVISVVVASGTLRKGDSFVVGAQSGKVRAMIDDSGATVNEAGPSSPVELLGASDICEAGDTLTVVDNDRKARQISQQRQSQAREERFVSKQHVRLENIVESLKDGETNDLKLVVKADTQGSVDAVKELLSKFNFEEVKLLVIHSGVGGITETDVMLANASDAIVIGFNVRPMPKAKQLAENEKIEIQLYSVIYEITDDIKSAVRGIMKPKVKEKTMGRAEVRDTFKVSKVGTIAGCRVVEGNIKRGSKARLVRDNVVAYTGTVSSLRRFKDDVKEVQNGYECGIGLENYNDVKNGDVIEVYVEEEVPVSI